ncbi:MAG TPA: host-nuclease inhibitor Gam family protein [Bacillota bacterium]|nr:host-nuclease inhibitor Gam family protein [Bacillota bacterium]HPZ93270.1 host-nuclease inhibitor Gam family protein [Bacillota bacterium]
MTSLEEYLLESYEAPEDLDDTENQRFRIQDDNQADWALRKIARARQDMKEAEETAAMEIEKINRWLDGQRDESLRTERFFTALLQEYYEPRFMTNPDKKTYKLPSGKVQRRTQQPQFDRDNEALLAWLKQREMTDYIEVKETPKWGELKQQVQVVGEHVVIKDGPLKGEIIDGVEVVHRPPTFRVVTTEGDDGNGI